MKLLQLTVIPTLKLLLLKSVTVKSAKLGARPG